MQGRHFSLPYTTRSKMVAAFLAGTSAADIARQFGVERHAVYRELKRNGIKPSDNQQYVGAPGTQADELARAYAEGVETVVEIAARFGVNRRAVYAAAKSRGIALRGGSKVVDESDVVVMYQQGWSQQFIADALGVSQVKVSRVLQKRGVQTRRGRGEQHVQWKGGRWSSNGYWHVFVKDGDPLRRMADTAGYALEHRIVMARHLGRALLPTETVHHIDGDRGNNSIGNLQLRQGRHGKGVVLRCRCCGSTDLEPAPLKGH